MPQLRSPQEEIKRLLTFVSKSEASDVHLKVGYPPTVRIGGQLRSVESPPLPDSQYIEQMMADMIPAGRRADYDRNGALDFAALSDSGDRFRVNLYRSCGAMHAAIRRVQGRIPDFDELNLPDIYRQVIMKSHEGLVLISGVTGCGKSSTLAAMLNYINAHRSMHVITIEDPIEFTFRPNKCIISQREIGIDVASFPEALRYVVRQDPDCILIGEMRDKETMLAALQAAETGHLVLGSIHCSDAEQTFSRMLEFFPREEHAFIRSSLANSLKAIMCQRLLPGVKPGVRYPATEVLLNNCDHQGQDHPRTGFGHARDSQRLPRGGNAEFHLLLVRAGQEESGGAAGRHGLRAQSRRAAVDAQRHRHRRRRADQPTPNLGARGGRTQRNREDRSL